MEQKLALRASMLAAALILAGSLVLVRASDKTQLTGYWKFNAAQSDDADQKVHEAQINSQSGVGEARGGGSVPMGAPDPGANNGGIYPNIGGMGGGRIGMGGPGGMGRGSRQGTRGLDVPSEVWDRLAANPKYLHVDQTSDKVVVSNDSDETQTFYADGKKHDDKDIDGKKISTKSSWDNDSFVAETKLSRAEKITQTFRLSENKKQLIVLTRFDDSAVNAPLIIRRVFDAGKEAGK